MNTSFKDAPTEEQPEVNEAALAEVDGDGDGETMPAVRDVSVNLALGNVGGSIDARDLIIPRFNIVQGVGPLSENFDSGDIVLNKEVLIASKGEPASLTVLSIRKTYEERLPYDPNGPRPVVYETLEQVVEAGYWVDWRNNAPPPVKEVATALVLVRKPDDVESLSFSVELEEELFALAVWTMRGTAYTRAAKKIFSANQIELAHTGLMTGLWELTTAKESINGNPIAVPILRLVGRNTPERVELIKSNLP